MNIFLLVFIFFYLFSFTQEEKNEELIINDKIYVKKANYFTVGEGLAYNFHNNTYEYSSFFSYTFNFKMFQLQLNYLLSSERFIIFKSFRRCNVAGFTIGKNIETLKYFFSFCAGPSYNFGYYYYGKNINGTDLYKGFSETGFILNIDFFYKFFYDFGIGPSISYSKSLYSSVFAITVKLFFSGAYRSSI
ncbi:MAG: hypothetical protein N3A01_09400 [Bacteroidales bacterium]|nr:hypothetical protein [Bacteroidales bacterium]